MNEDYMKDLRSKIIKTREFQFIPGRGQPRQVSLLEDGFIDDAGGHNTLAAWELSWDEARTIHCIKLFAEDSTIVTFLSSDKDGHWKGRDRRTKGTVCLIPLPLGDRTWEAFVDPTKWSQTIHPDPNKEEFHMLEPLPRQLDWTVVDSWDIRDHLETEKTKLPESNTAAILIGFNRPDYFEKVVQSIAQNPEAQTTPFFVFMDKWRDDLVTNRQIKVAKDNLPHCAIIRRNINLGCGRNIIDARKQIFDHLGYERAWVFEDDLVIPPNYMAYCNNLMEWGSNQYGNIGAVQGWTHSFMDLSEKMAQQHQVFSTYQSWWGYLMKKEAWDSIKDFLYSYQNLFLGGAYMQRPHRSVVKWFHTYMKDTPVERLPMYPENAVQTIDRRDRFNAPPSGQDGATWISFYQQGWVRLAPTVGRAQYIGKHGIHMNSSFWDRMKFEDLTLDVLEGDESIKEFIPA